MLHVVFIQVSLWALMLVFIQHLIVYTLLSHLNMDGTLAPPLLPEENSLLPLPLLPQLPKGQPLLGKVILAKGNWTLKP